MSMKHNRPDAAQGLLHQATLIGLPTDVGASRLGAAMGPDALRVAQLAQMVTLIWIQQNRVKNRRGSKKFKISSNPGMTGPVR